MSSTQPGGGPGGGKGGGAAAAPGGFGLGCYLLDAKYHYRLGKTKKKETEDAVVF